MNTKIDLNDFEKLSEIVKILNEQIKDNCINDNLKKYFLKNKLDVDLLIDVELDFSHKNIYDFSFLYKDNIYNSLDVHIINLNTMNNILKG